MKTPAPLTSWSAIPECKPWSHPIKNRPRHWSTESRSCVRSLESAFFLWWEAVGIILTPPIKSSLWIHFIPSWLRQEQNKLFKITPAAAKSKLASLCQKYIYGTEVYRRWISAEAKNPTWFKLKDWSRSSSDAPRSTCVMSSTLLHLGNWNSTWILKQLKDM